MEGMEGHCSKCGMKLESRWKFCPDCGAASNLEPVKKSEPQEHEKAPVQGAFSGLLFGMIIAPILLIVGTLLCLTGLGAILGIPMILAAVLSPLLGPMIGIGTLKGKCPWCGTAVNSVEGATKDFACLACSQRIAIRHREFVKAA
jgi:DNA-directed RNA polymerase subunit RPC12/RpoP